MGLVGEALLGTGKRVAVLAFPVIKLSAAVWICLMALRAMAVAWVSSETAAVCWMATGKTAAIMMKPMPRRMTAKRTSIKVKPE